MLAQRNRAWAGKIADLIRQGEPALVIVGAMHLIGPGSVVELLQARATGWSSVSRRAGAGSGGWQLPETRAGR